MKSVADPSLAPQDGGLVRAHPDDASDTGMSWGDVLLEFNASPSATLIGLLTAWRLYRPPTLKLLLDRFGLDQLHIL